MLFYKYLIFILIISCFTSEARAIDVSVNITGEIVIPPCTINNGQTININFGDMAITSLSDNKNVKTISIPINCAYYEGVPYIKISGTQLSGADTNILSTDILNFGLAMYQGTGLTTKMDIGNGITNGVDYIGHEITSGLSDIRSQNATFTFTVAPYKLGSDELSTGTFHANASMKISYY